jgi:hypothetical protein
MRARGRRHRLCGRHIWRDRRGVLVEVVPGSESGAGRGASSGSLLRVCCVRRSVNELGELQEALTTGSCT